VDAREARREQPSVLSLVANGGSNLPLKVGRNRIHLVFRASVIPDLADNLCLILTTNFPVAVHANVPARVGLGHTSLRSKGVFDTPVPPHLVRLTLALSCEAPALIRIIAVLRQLQRLVRQRPRPLGRCQRGGRAGPTRVTNVNSLVPALAEISQQPSVGNMSPLAWNPVG
jgi:hypothetical protein